MSDPLPRPFTLVTGNPDKRKEAERILGCELATAVIDLPELQSLDIGLILEAKADEAWRRLGRPLVVEETSLEIAALGGFPGPLVKWMLEAAGAETIARCALALGDPRATARCRLLFRDGETRVTGEGIAVGRLVHPARGQEGFGWDPVFQPDGSERTYAELGVAEKDAYGHRPRAWRDLLGHLAAVS